MTGEVVFRAQSMMRGVCLDPTGGPLMNRGCTLTGSGESDGFKSSVEGSKGID